MNEFLDYNDEININDHSFKKKQITNTMFYLYMNLSDCNCCLTTKDCFYNHAYTAGLYDMIL